MGINDEIREQTKKLKDMTLKEKWEYIWEYYKLFIIGGVIAVIAICSIVKSVVINNRPTYLTATFLNSIAGFDSDSVTVAQDFADYAGVDMNEYNFHFDYASVLNPESMDQNAYASQMKLMAQYAANELDIVCAPESIITGAADVGEYGNLEELLPAGMLDEIEDKGYEPFYYTQIMDTELKDEIQEEVMKAQEAGEEISAETQAKIDRIETKTYVGGIYIDNCDYLNSQGELGIYAKDSEDRAVLTIAIGSKNIDHAIEFIKFVTK